MLEKIKALLKRVINMLAINYAKKVNKDIQVSDKMAQAINDWFLAYYNNPPWGGKEKGKCAHQTKFPAAITNHMAVLATNELEINTGAGARAEYISEQLEKYVLPDLQSTVQLAGVGGAVVLKPYMHANNILCEVIAADRFFPTRVVGGVVEACFFTDFSKVGDKDVVRVEAHDLQDGNVYIHNEAFYKDSGLKVELSEVPAWESLPIDAIMHDVYMPMYAVIKMPYPNVIDATSKLPVSMYANSMDALEELDRIYSEFLWEIHTGKRRQIFDRSAIKMSEPGLSIGYKDMASDQYIVLDMGAMGNQSLKPYDDYTPEMRVEAYQKVIDVQLRLIETQCGLSPGTFTFDIRTGNAKTATEIISQDKTTYNTIKGIQDRGIKAALEHLVLIYNAYADIYFLAPSGKVEPSVSFGDSIFEDTDTEYKRRMSMVGAELLKPELFMQWYFGVTEDEARELMPDVVNADVE